MNNLYTVSVNQYYKLFIGNKTYDRSENDNDEKLQLYFHYHLPFSFKKGADFISHALTVSDRMFHEFLASGYSISGYRGD